MNEDEKAVCCLLAGAPEFFNTLWLRLGGKETDVMACMSEEEKRTLARRALKVAGADLFGETKILALSAALWLLLGDEETEQTACMSEEEKRDIARRALKMACDGPLDAAKILAMSKWYSE
jgi:hypothetical protein